MTIHHDKSVYGKLASSREDLSEQRLAEMLERLKAEQEKEKPDKPDKKEKD